jgi:hypothetical protein
MQKLLSYMVKPTFKNISTFDAFIFHHSGYFGFNDFKNIENFKKKILLTLQ